MPGSILVLRRNTGSLDSVADSLREAATALGMTELGWDSLREAAIVLRMTLGSIGRRCKQRL
jgi:hypothetical protein